MQTRLLHDDGQRTFVLVLDPGEEAVSCIEGWAADEGISAASVSAIGAFESVVLGYFDWEEKRYVEIPVDEQVEVVSLLGDVALAGERPKLHAHVVVGTRDASARAGHLMSGRVRPTLEVVVVESPGHLRRVEDAETGLALIAL